MSGFDMMGMFGEPADGNNGAFGGGHDKADFVKMTGGDEKQAGEVYDIYVKARERLKLILGESGMTFMSKHEEYKRLIEEFAKLITTVSDKLGTGEAPILSDEELVTLMLASYFFSPEFHKAFYAGANMAAQGAFIVCLKARLDK